MSFSFIFSSAHKQIKSARIITSTVSLSLPNFLSPPQHLPSLVATVRHRRCGRGRRREPHGEPIHSAFSDLFTPCLPLLVLFSEISFCLTFCRLPSDHFPTWLWTRLPLLVSWVHSLPPDSYLCLLTSLFVYCACGSTPTSPTTTHINTRTPCS